MQMMVVLALSGFHFDGNRMEGPMADPTPCDNRLRKSRYRLRRSFQDDRFNAVIVIQVRVHGRYGHIVMIVLHAHQAAGQLPFMMIIDIAQNAYAVFGDLGLEALRCDGSPEQISERL